MLSLLGLNDALCGQALEDLDQGGLGDVEHLGDAGRGQEFILALPDLVGDEDHHQDSLGERE